MALTNSEVYILQSIFGYTTGPVTVPGHGKIRIYKDQKRLLDAAQNLRRAGLVRIRDDDELPGNLILVTTVRNDPTPA